MVGVKRAAIRSLIVLMVLVSEIRAAGFVHAQEAALQLLKPVTGRLGPGQTEQRWTFSASKGQRLSLRMQANSGNLAPFLELLDGSGKALASSGGGSFRNALIDNLAVPETAIYTVRSALATGIEPTSGDYQLTLLPGFGLLVINDPIDERTPLRAWTEPNASSSLQMGKLRLQLQAEDKITWTTADRLGTFKDVYLQAEVQIDQARDYWEYGLLLRGAARNNALEFYVYTVNSDGKWRFALSRADKLTPIQDWTDLPAKGQPQATLGIMAKGNRFSLFHNGQHIADVSDDSLAEPGVIGVVVGTGKAPNISVSALFDNLIVTVPPGERGSERVTVPPALSQAMGAPEPLLAELAGARLIPGTGKPAFEIREAFVTNNTRGGIVFVPLAKGVGFSDVLYSADILWDSNSEDTACAMEMRAADASNFTIVYLDRKGGYGIRQVSDKQGTLASTYNLSDAILKDNRAVNRLTIIAVGNGLIVYINGKLAAELNVTQISGAVYIAAYNYAPASNYCQFNNLWLRSFD